MVDLDDWVVRARALAQTHPFRPVAYRYMKAAIQDERETQPAEEIAEWAGYALTVGYCVRAVEEDTGERRADAPPPDLPDDLEEATTHVAGLLRTEGAEPYLLSDEDAVVEALDRMIGGEIERRLGELGEGLDAESLAELEDYLAWWVIKGYALRTVERQVPLPHPAPSRD